MNWFKISRVKSWCTKHLFHIREFHFTYGIDAISLRNIIFICEITCEIFAKFIGRFNVPCQVTVEPETTGQKVTTPRAQS